MSRTTPKADLMNDVENYTCGEMPLPLEVLIAPAIDNWSTEVRHRGKDYILVVQGTIKRHPEHEDGDQITTAAVLWFDRKARFIRTHARVFSLGEPAGEEIGIDGVEL
jgi:hypothetical protein